MKQPTLADKRARQSSYFSASRQPNFEDDASTQDVSWKLRFPNSKSDLWNNMPCGEPVVSGVRHYHPLTLLCLQRCLRLAHRHASQSLVDGNTKQNKFHGFLMGTTTNSEDELGIVIDIDRFDPGTVRSSGHKTPSTPLPGDIVIPVIFTNGIPQAVDETSTFTVQDYENAFKLLHHQVSTRLPAENTSLFPVRLHCYYSCDDASGDDINLELHWVSPCISNSLRAVPIKAVPIIPTALAKNLSGPLNISAMQNSSKSGYISMNQSRKLLLLLDSDPKSRTIPTVGIWVSGVIAVHSPIVWLACMRYLHSPNVYERIMADGQFLLVLYSVMSQTPLFFQVKCDDNDKLNFDLLYTKETVVISKQPMGDADNGIEFRLESTTELLPTEAFKENEIFLEAVRNTQKLFNVPRKQKLDDALVSTAQDEENDEPPRGRQLKKVSMVPQSILRNSSGGRKSSGSRGRNSSTGVSFSLAVDDSEIFMDATPMPLPSPHPSTVAQSPALVKPSVPELSIIFDENYPAVNQPACNTRQQSLSPTKKKIAAEKLHSNSPGIRSPLKNIQNLNPSNRGISPHDPRQGPMKPPVNHYYHHPSQGITNSNGQAFFPQNAQLPVHRRSRSTSDCMRGQKARIHPQYPIAPPPRPNVTHHVAYGSSVMQGYGFPNGIQATVPAPHPYPNHPQQPRTRIPIRPQYSNQSFPAAQQMNSYSTSSDVYPPCRAPALTNPASFMKPLANSFQPHPLTTAHTNLLATQALNSMQVQQIQPPCNFTASQQSIVTFPPNPVSQAQSTSSVLCTESPSWMKQLPPEAYQLLMHQDAQLKMLQAQIQKLLAMQEQKQPSVVTATVNEMSTHTEPGSDVKSTVTMGTNTSTSLYIPNEDSKDVVDQSTDLTQSLPDTPVPNKPSEDDLDNQTHQQAVETPIREVVTQTDQSTSQTTSDQPRCDSQCTDKYPGSEYASIHLDETNIREIASTNIDEDSDVRSLASSLKAVDLPALETSTEQSSFGTPVQKIQSGLWSAQDSPVLGESASMCVVPPINLNRSLQDAEQDEGNEDPQKEEKPKDENFMKNLLSQVRDMLKKADFDGASDLSSENSAASTPQTMGKKTRVKKLRQSREDRVAKATRKQLRKMGVKLNDDTINAINSTTMASEKKKQTDFPFTFPEPLIPRLNYASIFAGASRSESIVNGPSSTDLSMHANAIALKYLSNEQLEEIAALSKVGKKTSEVFSPLKSKSGSSFSDSKPSIHDIFDADVKKLGERRLSGMSLVSPCNMSLATRKYMEKYGLIDCEGSSDEEDEKEEVDQPSQKERSRTPVEQDTDPSANRHSPVLRRVRTTSKSHEMKPKANQDGSKVPPEANGYSGFPKPEPGFSELKMNLGDTLDMILPFLDDLGRHRQQTPSSGTNGRDSRSGTRSTETESSRDRLTSISERKVTKGSNLRDHSPVETPQAQQVKKHKDNEVSQVLSPEVLRAVAEGKKLSQMPPASTQAGYNPPNSHRYNPTDVEEEEDFLAGTWPRYQFNSRSESELWRAGRQNSSKSERRQSSSPGYPADPPMSSRSCKGHRRPQLSPQSSAQMKRIRAIHDQNLKQLEHVKEVECSSENHTQENESEEEEEPVLTSRVTDAFKEKEESSNSNSEEVSGKESTPHFLEHLQTNENRTENENFLDLKNIRYLPKSG